jgi:hypothetical protein
MPVTSTTHISYHSYVTGLSIVLEGCLKLMTFKEIEICARDSENQQPF